MPDAGTTPAQDHDQMEHQVGITEPVLPPKTQDPNAPPGAHPADPKQPEGNWTDAEGHTITRSAFGLWNNYDSHDRYRLGRYPPINLLQMDDGSPVRTPGDWWTRRRPEIFRDVQEELYGRIPDRSRWPAITWSVSGETTGTADGVAYRQRDITGNIDVSAYPAVRNVPKIAAFLRLPAAAKGPVPVIVVFSPFGVGYGRGDRNLDFLARDWAFVAPYGYGICVLDPTVLQPDRGGAALSSYLIGLINHGHWRKPDDWGTLAAWSWGVSRLIDYFASTPDVDATKIGIEGHSRYGKAALVAMAYDPRILIGWPSSSGSLGAKLDRRHWGQDLEDSGWDQEYQWMAGNFFKWMGPLHPGKYLPRRVELLKVDGDAVVALCAPRPIFLTVGTAHGAPIGDSWVDPRGVYLAGLGASRVYEFLGRRGLIDPDPLDPADDTPRIDVAYLDGDIGFRRHHEGHTDVPDWPTFVRFASRYFNDRWPVVRAGQTFTLDPKERDDIGTVRATDPDADAVLKDWQITGGSDGAPSIFAIDAASGRLSLTDGAPRAFPQSTYTLDLIVSDVILSSKPQTVTIRVAP